MVKIAPTMTNKNEILEETTDMSVTAKLARAKRLKYLITFILSIPCVAVFNVFFNDNSGGSNGDTGSYDNSQPATGILSIDVGEQMADLFLSGFNLISTAMGYIAGYVAIVFCRKVYLNRVSEMVSIPNEGKKQPKPMKLEMLAMIHNANNAIEPSLALFTISNSLKAYLAIMLLVLSTVISLYATVIPLCITRYSDFSNEKNGQRLIPVIQVSDAGFSNANPFGSNGQKSGGFLTIFYYSQLPAAGRIFSQDLDNGTVTLMNFPFREEVTGSSGINNNDFTSTENIISLNETCLLVMDIEDWTYRIVPKDEGKSTLYNHVYDKWNVTGIEDGSYFYFGPDVNYSCFINTKKPWENCKVPDSMSFTLIQKLPTLDASADMYSNFKSDVFYLPGASIPDYPAFKANSSKTTETAYVFEGKLKFYQSTIRARRNSSSGQWLMQQLYPKASNKGTRSSRSFTTIENEIFTKIKIAAARLFDKQFNTQTPVGRSFTWNQLRELISMGRLDYEISNSYSPLVFKQNLVTRLTRVLNFWISVMASGGGDGNTINQSNAITVNFVTGRIVKRVSFALPVLVGVLILAIWIFITIVALIWSNTLKPYNEGSVSTQSIIRAVCSSGQGIAALQKRVSSPGDILTKKLVLTSDEKEPTTAAAVTLADPNYEIRSHPKI